MVQVFYWSADFLHDDKVSRLGVEIKSSDVSIQKHIILSLIKSFASVGYIYKGNSTLEEVRNEKGIQS